MNVAKNWALAILNVNSFNIRTFLVSSELLLKERMIIPVKKKRSPTLVTSTQNWSILAKFAKEKPSEIGSFLLIVSWRSFPSKFPVKSADFPKNLPQKILRNLTFFRQNPAKWLIFLRILTFLPRKSPEIGRLFREFWLFSRENPAKSADFSANLPLKIPRNFAFFSAKYQKPCHRYYKESPPN